MNLDEITAELWRRGELSFLMHDTQKVLNEAYCSSSHMIFVGNCSRQLGKSFFAVIKACEIALKNPKCRIRFGAPFATDVTEFIIPTFEKVLDSCPDYLRPTYKSQGTKFVFKNGAEIKLVGLDKRPNAMRGANLKAIFIDECGFVDSTKLKYVYESVIIPATTHSPDARVILLSTPPVSPDHSFLQFCQKAEAEGGYRTFTIFANPLLQPSNILRLMKETGCIVPDDINTLDIISNIQATQRLEFPPSWTLSVTFRREYLAEFLTDQDLAIIPEWKDEHIKDIEQDEYYGFYHKYVGMDLGVKDFTALIFGTYNFKEACLYIEDELVMNGPSLTTESLVKELKIKEAALWGQKPPFRRISDNNNLHLLQDLASIHNIHFGATNKDTLEAMINEVRLMVQAGQIKVSPKCTQLIGCLKYGIWTSKKDKFAKSASYGHFDALAALIYLVRNLSKHTNPIPADYGKHISKHAMHNLDLRNQSAKALEQALGVNKQHIFTPHTPRYSRRG